MKDKIIIFVKKKEKMEENIENTNNEKGQLEEEPKNLDDFSKEEFKQALINSKVQIEQLELYNKKMAYSVRLFFNNLFTYEEKESIGKDIDAARNEEEIEKVFEKYQKRANNKKGNYIKENHTPEFSRNLHNYIKDIKGEDIFSVIKENMQYLKKYFDIIDKLENENLEERERKTLEDTIQNMNNQCKSSIKTIYNILDE